MAILSPDEIEALYKYLEFNAEERATYFQLTTPEKTDLSQLGTTTSKIHFISQLSYWLKGREGVTSDPLSKGA